MNSHDKTEQCDLWCQGCEDYTDKLEDEYGYMLCSECNDTYENTTGYCPLSCCVGRGCDQSC